MRILVTGASGFLGQEVLFQGLEQHEISVLQRKKTISTPLSTHQPTVLQGDILKWNLGLDPDAHKGRFDAFVHLAALYDLRASESDLQMTNVVGTHNALAFAKAAQIPIFAMASTVAVTINQVKATVGPTDLDLERPFPDHYARTKASAEALVVQKAKDFKAVLNFRLGILVGSSRTGNIERVDGPYAVIQSLKRLVPLIKRFPKVIPLPGSSHTRLPVVPVDIAASAMLQVIEKAELAGYQSFHIAPNEGLSLKEFYQDTLRHLRVFRQKPVLLNSDLINSAIRVAAVRLGAMSKEEAGYAKGFSKLDTGSVRNLLGDGWCPEYADYKKQFWSGYENFISHR
jgi:UDP-glucose 4-epimerase